MTLDLDNMTQAEFDGQMAEIKERNPNLFQFIADFVDRKVSTEEVDEFLKMERTDQVDYIMAVGQAVDAFRLFTELEPNAERLAAHFEALIAAQQGVS